MNREQILMENAIEITWIFDQLVSAGKIKPLPEIGDSRSVRDTIELIAEEFEEHYANTDWKAGELDYLEEIEELATRRLIRYYGRSVKIQ